MMKILKKHKKKILIILGGFLIFFNLIFKTVWVEGYQGLEKKYEKHVVFANDISVPQLIVLTIDSPREITLASYFVMFRWEYSNLIQEMKTDIEEETKRLSDEYEIIVNYDIDWYLGVVNLYCEGLENEEILYHSLRRELAARLEGRVYQYFRLLRRDEILYDEKGNREEKGCVRIWQDDTVVYMAEKELVEVETNSTNEKDDESEDLKNLKEILARSEVKTPEDLKSWRKVQWSYEGEGDEIEQMDLSDYSDITGELDLSVFSELRYVKLSGMKISSVKLPENLECIDEESFRNCKKLKIVTIGKGVEMFYSPVFDGCTSLEQIIFEGDAPDVEDVRKSDWVIPVVFGKVGEKFRIYRKEGTKGWVNACWDDYEMIIQ